MKRMQDKAYLGTDWKNQNKRPPPKKKELKYCK